MRIKKTTTLNKEDVWPGQLISFVENKRAFAYLITSAQQFFVFSSSVTFGPMEMSEGNIDGFVLNMNDHACTYTTLSKEQN